MNNSRHDLLAEMYGNFCKENKLNFHTNTSILSPDNTTLFCTSGMHRFKPLFANQNHKQTVSNIQTCLRLNDLDEIGDGTHYLVFHMLGLFSFREWSVPKTIDFWMSFLQHIDLLPQYVTIHPDKMTDWKSYYSNYNVEVREDSECVWSDGNIGGYCTEFYRDGVEIGNIVNTLGSCIDVGFGGERILALKGLVSPLSKPEILSETITALLKDNVQLANSNAGYVLKKLITLLVYQQGYYNHPYYHQIFSQQKQKWRFYLDNHQKPKFADKKPDWWLDTHGVNLSQSQIIKFLGL